MALSWKILPLRIRNAFTNIMQVRRNIFGTCLANLSNSYVPKSIVQYSFCSYELPSSPQINKPNSLERHVLQGLVKYCKGQSSAGFDDICDSVGIRVPGGGTASHGGGGEAFLEQLLYKFEQI